MAPRIPKAGDMDGYLSKDELSMVVSRALGVEGTARQSRFRTNYPGAAYS